MVVGLYECCNHKWKQTGTWDGTEHRGPIAKCENCGEIMHFTWEEWNTLPEESKTSL